MSASFATQQTVAHQTPLYMGFPRQEYWSGLPFPSPGNLPNQGIKPASPALAGRFFTTETLRKPLLTHTCVIWYSNNIDTSPLCTSHQAKTGSIKIKNILFKARFSISDQIFSLLLVTTAQQNWFSGHERSILPCPLKVEGGHVTCYGQWMETWLTHFHLQIQALNCLCLACSSVLP